MTPPTPEELLRLARKVAACAAAWQPAARLIGNATAGEVLLLANSVAALLAERDRLRAGIADTIEAMDAARAAKSAPGNEAYDEGFNMACGFARQLQVVLDDPKEDP